MEESGCGLEPIRAKKLWLNPDKVLVLLVGPDSALSSGRTLMLNGAANNVARQASPAECKRTRRD